MTDFTGNRDRVRNYFSVTYGKITQSLGSEKPENMEGVTERKKDDGSVVYEIQSDYIRGYLVGASFKEPPEEHPDWSAQLELKIESEEGRKCILNIPFDSGYGRGFMYACEGIKLDAPIEIEPYRYHSKKKGKEVIGLNIFQHGEDLPWTYGTKEKPGGMPKLKKVTFKGKETWDNTDQLAFLRKKWDEFANFVNDNSEDVRDARDTEVNDPEEVSAHEGPKPGDDF